MRITGGELAGRTVQCPPGVIRPAMDQMRESVFAVLGDLSGKSFLDLFAGSGIIALEAASRGAKTIELVEKDRLKIGTVLQNAAMAERALGKRIACHFVAAELFLKRCKNQYDLIFCDPPFPYKFHQQIAETLSAKNLLKPGGLFLMHYPRELNLPEHTGSLARCDRREYGRSIVDFFQKETI